MAVVTLVPLPAEAYDDWFAQVLDRAVPTRYLGQTGDEESARALAEKNFRASLPEGLATPRAHVVHVAGADGSLIGSLYWRQSSDLREASVGDVHLDDLSVAGEVRSLVEAEARAAGATSLWTSLVPGDSSRAAFADGGGFESKATNMAIDLRGDPVHDDGRITLQPMTSQQFDDFMSEQRSSYVETRVQMGESPELAREIADTQFAALVPDGLNSPGQRFWTAYDGDTTVGTLWIDDSQPRAFVYDVIVDEAQRRKGYGRSIMTAGARWCQENGSISLGLNVFGHNNGARALYDQLGYVITEDGLAKDL
ncbi:GNAT family N-acetyltransferase [Luteipulveratus mongoliensis]|uniref:GNAT family N-acetyltransferase n=1 Tax=Luteipulveratus mongoliensis TaxID=571913 RepID=UPI0006961DDD|nr:GNAT family N-acetyltransferase [Luteipulveratus mongoliensis]